MDYAENSGVEDNKKDENPKSNNEPTPEHAPTPQKTFGKMVQGILKSFSKETRGRELTNPEKDALTREIKDIENLFTKNGVDFSRIQINDVLTDRDEGRQIEFETFSPYLADYNLGTGEIWEDQLMPEDIIGLELANTFKQLFPEGALVSLYDEYNNEASTEGIDNLGNNLAGVPILGPQQTIPEEVRARFRTSIIELLKKRGAIAQDEIEGKDYYMVSESSKQEDALILSEQLKEKGMLEGNTEEGKLIFVNPDAENPLFRRITLRTANGRWLCEALDASSFLKPENRDITHIIALPEHMKDQQDKVWEILNALDIARPDTYHNIFYDKTADVNTVVQTIREEFAKYESK